MLTAKEAQELCLVALNKLDEAFILEMEQAIHKRCAVGIYSLRIPTKFVARFWDFRLDESKRDAKKFEDLGYIFSAYDDGSLYLSWYLPPPR